jgi:hypothetical protein
VISPAAAGTACRRPRRARRRANFIGWRRRSPALRALDRRSRQLGAARTGGVGDDEGPIAFQRGRIEGRGARGRVLEPQTRLLIDEEEVPREGVRVARRFQSARGTDGRLHVWAGRRKGPGRGEGSSRLEFDAIDRGV